MGQLTGPTHQVLHQAPKDLESLEATGQEGWSVTVMVRTALFAANRARQRNTTPSPPEMFEALAGVFREFGATREWRMPTLRQCLDAEASSEALGLTPPSACASALASAAPSAPPAKRRCRKGAAP